MIKNLKKCKRFFYSVYKNKSKKKLPNHILNRFEDTQSVFIHIPKTAGISVEKALYGENVKGIGHATAGLMKWTVGPVKWYRYFTFTLVRHPYDRIESAYFYLKNGGRGPWDQKWVEKHFSHVNSFEEFIETWLTEENILKGEHFIPQHQFVYKGNKLLVDFIGKFETINKDFETIKKRVNKKAVLSKKNVTPYKKFINRNKKKELEKKIFQMYKEDYLRFGYKTYY